MAKRLYSQIGMGSSPVMKKQYRKGKSFRKSAKKNTFAAKVMKVVHSKAEVKRWSKVVNQTAVTSVLNNAGYVALLPFQPAQGSSEGQRNGDKCRLRRVMLKGFMAPSVYDATANPTPPPLEVRMVLMNPRNTPQSIVGATSNFFLTGATVGPALNTFVDQVEKIDVRQFQVWKEQQFKLGFEVFATTLGGAGQDTAYGQFSNNDFKLNQKFEWDITKAYQQLQTFYDATTTSECRVPSLCVFTSSARGTAYVNAAYVVAQITYTVEFEYEDL